MRFARDHVEEGFDDERGRDLPTEANEGYADQIYEPEPGAKTQHFPDDFPCGQRGYFLIEGCFGHDNFLEVRWFKSIYHGEHRVHGDFLKVFSVFFVVSVVRALRQDLFHSSLQQLIKTRGRVCGELFTVSVFADIAFIQNHDLVCAMDCVEPMRDDDGGSVFQ